MGTRSLTFIKDNGGEHLATVYRQFDGYPSGHGKDIAALADRKIVNGISAGFHESTHANGFGELAAKIICALKSDKPEGGIYIASVRDPESEDLMGADYIYIVKPDRELSGEDSWSTEQPQVIRI
jgi:hypothetical protein